LKHRDHLGLIAGGVRGAGPVWADLGSGEGAFTLALADVLGPGARIHSVDVDAGALQAQRQAMHDRFPRATVRYVAGDFTRAIPLPPLDGVVMANSLHFVRDKEPVLERVREWLKPGGRLVLVEYDADTGSPWVPYPLSYATWSDMAGQAGFTQTRLLGRVPSRHLQAIFSAVSFAPASASPPRTTE
jgi:ubiquinone/menaquinone biosynthesis C-methylase UbiE